MITENPGNIGLPWLINLNSGVIPVCTNTAFQMLARESSRVINTDNNNLEKLLEIQEDIIKISRNNGFVASQWFDPLFLNRFSRRIQQLQHEERSFDPHHCHAFCFCTGKQ